MRRLIDGGTYSRVALIRGFYGKCSRRSGLTKHISVCVVTHALIYFLIEHSKNKILRISKTRSGQECTSPAPNKHAFLRNAKQLQSVSWILEEFYFNRGLKRLYTGTCIILQKTINGFLCLLIVFLKSKTYQLILKDVIKLNRNLR